MTSSNPLGIVVIGRNEGERLRRCLLAASAQGAPVVYVDSASTDDSVALARPLVGDVFELADDLPFTAARGRSAGLDRLLVSHPSCQFVQFLDGDCLLQSGWIETALRFLAGNEKAAAVCGRRFEAEPDASIYNQIIDEEWDTPIGKASACGGDSIMRVAALRDVGSFRADLLAGEEPELCSRLAAKGWEVWRLDAPMTEHDANISHLSQWLRRAKRGGLGYAQVHAATRSLTQPLYGRQIFSALFWSVGVPLGVTIIALLASSALLLLLIPILWLAQIGRMALKRDPRHPLARRLQASAVMFLSKFAEAAGVIRFWLSGASTANAGYHGPPAQATHRPETAAR